MTVLVHTYPEPKQWRKHAEYNSLKNAIHISATYNMKLGIKECYEELQHVFSVREFINTLFEDWYSPERKLQQYLLISKVIRDMHIMNPNLKQAFRTNSSDVLESIRSFVESGVRPNSLLSLNTSLTEKEQVFQAVWHRIEQLDLSYTEHRENLYKLGDTKDILSVINALRDEDSAIYGLNRHVHIYLHGFYFITPEQQTLFEYLSRIGIDLTFFHYYDPRFPETFDFMKQFVNSEFGWPDYWQVPVSNMELTNQTCDIFLNAYETTSTKNYKSNLEVVAYNSFFDFLHTVILPNFPVQAIDSSEEVNPGVQIIATNADILNEMITSYYPELDKKNRNFLSYPIGRFLITIHEVYDQGALVLTEDILMSLFSSGWLYDDHSNENAQNYTYDLEQIFPYFQGCHKIDEWIERLTLLLNQYQMIRRTFQVNGSDRIVKSMQSPFSKLSYFAVAPERVDQIVHFFQGIKIIVEDLFEASQETNTIDDHFKRLLQLVTEQNKLANTLINKTERLLIHSLNKKLEMVSDVTEFLYDDLKLALNFYLSGKFESNENTRIRPFIDIDGEAFKNSTTKVYLTGLDEQGLPLGTYDIPWPLDSNTFTKLSERHRTLKLHTIRNDSTKAMSRYLFFIALRFLPKKQLELSWIRNFLDRENLNVALYLRQLDLEIVSHTATQIGGDLERNIFDFTTYRPDPVKKEVGWKTFELEDFFAEHVLCPKRFYYSYVLDEFPVFKEDFMHPFIFSEIIKFVTKPNIASFDTVFQEVSVFFPQWLKYKKQIIAKEAYKYHYRNERAKTAVDDQHYFTDIRKNFQFTGIVNELRNQVFEESATYKLNIREQLQNENNTSFEAKAGYNCRFCPHNKYCPDVEFSIDVQKEKS